MKRFLKLFALVLALTLVVVTLAACSGSGDNANANDTSTTTGDNSGTADAASSGDAGNGATAGQGSEFNLSFALHGNPSHYYVPALERWRDAIYEETNGRLWIEMYYGGTLASPTDEVGLVQQGGADLTWNTNSLAAALFQQQGIIGAYGEELTNTLAGTYAMLKMYENCPAISNEYADAGLKLLALHTQTPSSLGCRGSKVESPADYAGLSIQSISKNCIGILDSFGAAVIGVTPSDLYENLSKNVCSATMVDSALYAETRLYEEIDYFNTFNYNSSIGFVVMNQSVFDGLPADIQNLLDSKYEDLSYEIAKDTNDGFRTFLEETLPENNVEVYGTSDEMIAAVNEKFQEIIVEPYRQLCEERGYDADEIMSQMEQYIKEGKEKYGSEYDWFAGIKK